MLVNLNKNLVGLDGVEINNAHLGRFVANYFANSGEGDFFKLMGWAKKLHDNEILDLDKSDEILFKDLISKNNQFTNIMKFQILESLT